MDIFTLSLGNYNAFCTLMLALFTSQAVLDPPLGLIANRPGVWARSTAGRGRPGFGIALLSTSLAVQHPDSRLEQRTQAKTH